MATTPKNWTVETDWLHNNQNASDLVIFDSSWYLPTSGHNPREEYLDEHIPNSLYFDIEDISDISTSLPHMLSNPIKFAARMRRLGVGDGMRIIVYDQIGLFSAARVWWNFRVMGVDEVYILNGGLAKWTNDGYPIDGYPHRPRIERHFTSRFNSIMAASLDDVKAALKDDDIQIIDARPAPRFQGLVEEPRKGLRMGHIPGAINIESSHLLNTNKTIKTNDELRQIFHNAGVDLTKPIITSCGSGITAAIPFLALHQIGIDKNVSLYDGSWAEWGADHRLPIEVGA